MPPHPDSAAVPGWRPVLGAGGLVRACASGREPIRRVARSRGRKPVWVPARVPGAGGVGAEPREGSASLGEKDATCPGVLDSGAVCSPGIMSIDGQPASVRRLLAGVSWAAVQPGTCARGTGGPPGGRSAVRARGPDGRHSVVGRAWIRASGIRRVGWGILLLGSPGPHQPGLTGWDLGWCPPPLLTQRQPSPEQSYRSQLSHGPITAVPCRAQT